MNYTTTKLKYEKVNKQLRETVYGEKIKTERVTGIPVVVTIIYLR